jgi:type IX secretion system PorP/SprF family membrane protein
MTMKTRIFLFILLCLFTLTESRAQAPHSSQFYNLPLQLNPARAGEYSTGFRVGAAYRNQWGSMDKGYRTMHAYGDMGIPSKKLDKKSRWGAGFSIVKDKSGEIGYGVTSAEGSGAIHMPTARHQMVSFGMRLAVTQTSLDPNGLRWGNQYNGEEYDPTLAGEPFRFQNHMFGDIGAGIQWTYFMDDMTMTSKDSRTIKIGAMVNHVTRPRVNAAMDNDSRLNMKYTGHFTGDIGIKNTDISLHPSGYYTQQGKNREVVLGCLFRHALRESSKYTGYIKSSGIGVGLHLRMGDAIIPCLFWETAGTSIGLSYDMTLSSLKKAPGMQGGPELLIRFRAI